MKYTVRSASGKIVGKAYTKNAAEEIRRDYCGKGGYIKSDRDPVYPLKEQTKW